jgi:HK97 gp10 family phage protein
VNEVRVEGLSELKELLQKRLPEHIQTKALQSSLAIAAKPIVQDAKSRVPVKTGLLRRSIYSFRSRRSTKQKAVRLISVKSGSKAKAPTFYWRFVEFGRGIVKVGKKRGAPRDGERAKSLGNEQEGWFGKEVKAMPAQPFLRPAFESMKFEAIEKFRASMAGEIEKFANRYQKSIVNRISRKIGL